MPASAGGLGQHRGAPVPQRPPQPPPQLRSRWTPGAAEADQPRTAGVPRQPLRFLPQPTRGLGTPEGVASGHPCARWTSALSGPSMSCAGLAWNVADGRAPTATDYGVVRASQLAECLTSNGLAASARPSALHAIAPKGAATTAEASPGAGQQHTAGRPSNAGRSSAAAPIWTARAASRMQIAPKSPPQDRPQAVGRQEVAGPPPIRATATTCRCPSRARRRRA